MSLNATRLQAYRDHTYRRTRDRRVRTHQAAVEFINERGFVYFWPVRGIELPSLWVAAAGERPVPAEHDDPGHITWEWKDSLLGTRQVFYAHVLRGRATFIALDELPWFYALSENYGLPESDYQEQYAAGRLTTTAKQIYEALLENGPLDTLNLRRAARLTAADSSARFERALVELQRDFKILPVGIAAVGAWRYAYVYELVARWWPHLAEQARPLGRTAAQAHLLARYLQAVGAITEVQAQRLFQWSTADMQRAVDRLVQEESAWRAAKVAGEQGRWLVIPELNR